MTQAIITIVIPSFNQGQYLDDALTSIFEQDIPIEVLVIDGGSTDNTLEVLHKWEKFLLKWRSFPDDGQAAAINEGIALGSAPYVTWLNSDDFYLPGGLNSLLTALEANPTAPMAYGNALDLQQKTGIYKPVWVQQFTERKLANRCIICQPASLIRRTAWTSVGGVDPTLEMSMDYDLWWRLYKSHGEFIFLNSEIAVNRIHSKTKTNTNRLKHSIESIKIVKKYYGSIPLKWYFFQPISILAKSIITTVRRFY